MFCEYVISICYTYVCICAYSNNIYIYMHICKTEGRHLDGSRKTKELYIQYLLSSAGFGV